MTAVGEQRVGPVLDAVPELSGPRTITALSGGITNQNFRVDAGGASYVVRLSGDRTELLGIDRAREHACSRAAEAAGVGAPVVAFVPEHGALVTRFVAGRTLVAADLRDGAILERAIGALKRLHESPPFAGRFSSFETVRAYHALALERGLDAPAEVRTALEALARIEQEVRSDEAACPCHNDLLPANFLDDGRRITIIDWEYAGMGDRFFDLANLAAGFELDDAGERALLQAYFGAARATDHRKLRLMRLASDMREALWGFLQSRISTLDFDFVGYGRQHLERFLSSASE